MVIKIYHKFQERNKWFSPEVTNMLKQTLPRWIILSSNKITIIGKTKKY